MEKKASYNWKFKVIGGTSRIDISSGEDIRHLGELDQKLWTVLSCPTTGLEFDQKTLDVIDSDKDGRIRVGEIVSTANYLCSVIKDADLLLTRSDSIALSQFNTDSEEGRKLHDSARQILANLGLDKDSISLADSSDNAAIFAKTKFNGDGVVTPFSADDEAVRTVIEDVIATTGGRIDRSGIQGIDSEQLEAFFTSCADYSQWRKALEAEGILPYGDNTEAALSAVEAISAKVQDYFMRCKLAVFDAEAAPALDVQVSKISEISGNDLSLCGNVIAQYPIARVTGESLLPFNGINPAWQGAFDTLKKLVLDVDFKDRDAISESEWNEILHKLSSYSAWKASKAGASVEALGIDRINEILDSQAKDAIAELIAQDRALEAEASSIDSVDNFLRLYKHFYTLLRNFVTFDDFFDKKEKAVFQAGRLYIDQRSLELCIKVADMGKHGDMAKLSGMYIIYCSCNSKATGKKLDIAAVLTDGDVDNLRVGMNAVFYDWEGVDYDAVVTKIVDNPVSIRQAFLAPYKKFIRSITEKINKNALEKSNKVDANLSSKVNTVSVPTTKEAVEAAKAANPPAQSFDIAKFAGIFAALGMALGMIGSALMKLIDPWYNLFTLLIVLVLCISGPSMFMAWQKLRKRNLAPMLNANGWAINARVLVNIAFGATLTSLAKFPAIELIDLGARKKRSWRRFKNVMLTTVLLAVLTFVGYKLYMAKYAPEKTDSTEVTEQIEKQQEITAPAEENAEQAA